MDSDLLWIATVGTCFAIAFPLYQRQTRWGMRFPGYGSPLWWVFAHIVFGIVILGFMAGAVGRAVGTRDETAPTAATIMLAVSLTLFALITIAGTSLARLADRIGGEPTSGLGTRLLMGCWGVVWAIAAVAPLA